jgi:hypothetical protein
MPNALSRLVVMAKVEQIPRYNPKTGFSLKSDKKYLPKDFMGPPTW